MRQNNIVLIVKNNIVPLHLMDNSKTGTGIDNVKRRLELMYPGAYELKINQSENNYQVNLNIKIK